MPDCGQTNIPEVNNDALECEEFVNDICVNFPNASAYLGIPRDSNLRDYVDALIRIIQNNQRLIAAQRTEIDQLRVDVDQLRTDVDTYHP